jgi:hypothetical protein
VCFKGLLPRIIPRLPFAGEAPTNGFGVNGVEFSVLLIAESVTAIGLLDAKMTALNVVKLLTNDT